MIQTLSTINISLPEELPDLRHLALGEVLVEAEVGLPEDGVQHGAIVVEAVLEEERPPALVDVAQRHRGEEHVVQGSSERGEILLSER